MKIHVDENDKIVLSEVFTTVVIRTPEGDFGVCQRDGGIEIVLDGKLVFAYPKHCPLCSQPSPEGAVHDACADAEQARIDQEIG